MFIKLGRCQCKKSMGWFSFSESETDSIEDVPFQQQNRADVTEKVVGDFGRWQMWISILMSLLKLSNAWYQLNIMFMAPQQEFWCAKPHSLSKYTEEEWRKMSTPKVEEYPCFIFDPDMLAISPDMERSFVPLVQCNEFVYDKSVFKRTITDEWDLVCDKHWMVHINQVVMMWGVLLGGVFFGNLADKHGRKKPLIIAIVVQAVASFIASVLTSYWWFLANWFILALASGGTTIISFVICLEVVSGKWRTIIPVLYQMPFGLGTTVMAALAYYFRDWRKLEFALASLSSLYMFYWFCIPESPRWLIANGQTEEAVEVLYKGAQINKRDWSRDKIRHLISSQANNMASHNTPPFSAFFTDKSMRLKTLLLSLNWLFTGIAFYTFSQYLGGIGSNIFLTVAITGIISVPGPIVCVFVITRLGRKATIWVFQFLTSLCFVIILVIPSKEYWPRVLFAGIGFAAMAATVPTLYLYSGELYPTLGRNRGVGIVTMFARLGSMTASYILLTDSIMHDLPLILLAITSFGQMVLLLPLPETKDTPLPDTIEQAELITKKSTHNNRRENSWTKIKKLLH